jgi:hypothetical protein
LCITMALSGGCGSEGGARGGARVPASARRRLQLVAPLLQRPATPAPTAVTTLQVSTTRDAELLPVPSSHPSPAQRKFFDDNGYLIVDDMCNPEDIAPLLAESRRIVRGVRDGSLLREEDAERSGIAAHADPESTWAIRGLLSPALG